VNETCVAFLVYAVLCTAVLLMVVWWGPQYSRGYVIGPPTVESTLEEIHP
jgi:hypothetical protein